MKYSLNLKSLAAIPEGFLPSAMWEFYLDYSQQAQNRGTREFDLTLPRGLRFVRSIIRFDGDNLNGGITQYVSNHTQKGNPEQVFEDLETLKTIGAVESAAILEEAIAIFARHGWPSGEDQSTECDEDERAIERLDERRCNEESSYRDYALLDAYLRLHLDECVLPVEVESDSINDDGSILRNSWVEELWSGRDAAQ